MSVLNENYVIIQGWMLNELELKGNELIIFAVIYGVTQDGSSQYFGTRSYLSSWCNCTLPTVDRALENLIEKGLIEKEQRIMNNLTFNTYKVSLGGIKKFYRGCKNSLQGYKEILYNNNNIYNKYNNKNNIKEIYKEKEFVIPSIEDVKKYCEERNNNVDYKKFYDYYNINNWKDKNGKKVRNWKQKLITWEKHMEVTKVPNWFNKDIDINASNEDKKEMENILKEIGGND